MQTQTSNTLHNAIMEAGGKDRLPMLAPDKEVPISEGSFVTTTETYMENYKNISQDIHNKLNAKAEAVQIILTEIDNDIYSIVDACPNACEMWKAIERSQQAATRNRGKAIVNSPSPIYNQEPSMVAEDDEMSKDKEIDKLMVLISLSGVRYDNQRLGKVDGARETVDAADSGQIFDTKPVQRVPNNDNYNVFAIECKHPEQSKSVHDTYPIEQDEHNVIIDSLDMRIDNDIYSTVDACPNACKMWKAIESLKHGESINVQDLETNLYWEFGKFTSRDGEPLKSYYSRFYKMMNELVKNQCDHQNEVNEIRAERIACTTNPLALVAQQQPVYHPQNHPTHYTQNSSTRSQQATTRNRGKAIVNSPPPIYDQEPSMVAEDDEMSKDKEIDKLMALISLSFKKIYKPTNNKLRTSSNTSRANQDNSSRINRGIGYDNQRLGNDVGARETAGTTMVQKSRIQCNNCKEFGHVARECQKPKRVKDAAYHREKMLLCKQKEAGTQLNAEQVDWRDDTDDESEDQELEAHYMYVAQIQEVSQDAAADS
nr:hypothetical protein [Tanacetum cinerariifolium]